MGDGWAELLDWATVGIWAWAAMGVVVPAVVLARLRRPRVARTVQGEIDRVLDQGYYSPPAELAVGWAACGSCGQHYPISDGPVHRSILCPELAR